MIGENFFKIKSLTNLNVGSFNRNFWVSERGDKGKRKRRGDDVSEVISD